MIINQEPVPYKAQFMLNGELVRIEIMATNAFDGRKIVLSQYPDAKKIVATRKRA